MEMSTKARCRMINPMVMAYIYGKTDQNIKVNGKMIYFMGMERRRGRIIAYIMDITTRAKCMVSVYTFGLMVQAMKEIGIKMQ